MQIWTPPSINKVKVNVDAAIKEDRKLVGKKFSRSSVSSGSEKH